MAKNGNCALTFFMMPFYLRKAFDVSLPEGCYWVRKDMTLETNIFYPYLQQFLTNTAHKYGQEGEVQPYDYYTYSYENDSDMFVAIEDHDFYIDLKDKDGGRPRIVRFRLGREKSKSPSLKNTFFTPKLIVCPIAEVGVLIIPIEVQVPTSSLEDLRDFNYKMHHNQQDILFHISYEKIFEEINAQLNRFDNKGKEKDEEWCQASREKANKIWDELNLEAIELRKLFGNKDMMIEDHLEDHDMLCLEETPETLKVNIAFSKIRELLMEGLDGWYDRFNDIKYHLFTFIELGNTDVTPKLLDDFHHITTCTNNSYRLLKSRFDEQCAQTFENVYIGSSVEGGAMMIIKPKPSTEFWDEFSKAQLDKRYMWFYIMALMQRHTLIHHIYKLTQIYSGGKTSMKLLREEVDKTSKLGVNTYFTELTDHTQHNLFYAHCRKNLNIDRLRDEQAQKMEMLNDSLESKSDRVKQKQQWILATLVGILTIFSATNDGMDVVFKKFDDGALAFYHLHQDDWLVQTLHSIYHLGGGVWSLYLLYSVIIMAPIIIGLKYWQYSRTNNK